MKTLKGYENFKFICDGKRERERERYWVKVIVTAAKIVQ